MSKPLIIIADTDELYLQNLERKFLEEFDDPDRVRNYI